ncbi:hypothetical protein JYQ62_12535 [Nostoc sp. UHCC 0702]|nr:hypothetical protein JYQ62_12535 [Nostoc sp. UHCC 0702]
MDTKRLFEKSNLLLPWRLEVAATRDKTHLRGFQTLAFALVRAGGREFV